MRYYTYMNQTHLGLSDIQVKESIQKFGTNAITQKKPETLLMLFLKQFQSPLVYILCIVAVITLALREYSDSVVILFVVIINAVISTVQQKKATHILASLKQMSQSQSKVIRNGLLQSITINHVVMGDYVVLTSGDIVPADGELIEHSNLRINESKINGESMPVGKDDEHKTVYRSTVVVSGSGIFIVTKIGDNTMIGELGKQVVQNIGNKTVLEIKIEKLTHSILIAVFIVSTLLVLLGIYRDIEFFVLFKTAISLAVSAIPEGLPIVLTVVLAIGAWRISKVHGLLKNLPSGATLATVSTICTDKTGTLTLGTMTVREIIAINTSQDLDLNAYIVHSLDVKQIGKQIVGDILDTTLYEHLGQFQSWSETKEMPFTSELKYNAKEYLVEDKRIQIFKGAPELFIDPSDARLHTLVTQGYRVLAVASKLVEPDTDFHLSGTTMQALLVFEDPIRSDVASAIVDCKQAGLNVMMITGDNIYTAKHVAHAVGIYNPDNGTDGAIVSTDMQSYTDAELTGMLQNIKVIARATPFDKLRVVRLLQEQKHKVAMTGDGVNDGPSIALADIGIAMGKTGTEVAKEAADFILVNDSFSNIRDGIFEARTIFENIRKALIFLLSTSCAEIIIILVSLGTGLPLPLLPVQILWLNLITDGFLDVALANEPAEPAYKTYNYNRYRGGLLSLRDIQRMLLMSMTMTIVCLGFFVTLLQRYSLEITQSVMLACMSIIQWFNALNVRKQFDSIVSYRLSENPYLVGVIALEVVLLLLSIYTPLGNRILRTVGFDSSLFAYIATFSLAIVVVDELYKFFQRKRKHAHV